MTLWLVARLRIEWPGGHCVVFLGKTLYSHSTSLHPGVQIGTASHPGGGAYKYS